MEVLEARTRFLGEDHSDTLWTLAYASVVRILLPEKDFDSELTSIEEGLETTASVLEKLEDRFSTRHPRLGDLRWMYIEVSGLCVSTAVERAREHDRNANSRRFGTSEERAEESQAAETRRGQAVEWVESARVVHRAIEAAAVSSEERRRVTIRAGILGRALAALDRWGEARPYLEDALSAAEAAGSTSDPAYLKNALHAGYALLADSQEEEAAELFQRVLAGRAEVAEEMAIRAEMEDVIRKYQP